MHVLMILPRLNMEVICVSRMFVIMNHRRINRRETLLIPTYIAEKFQNNHWLNVELRFR